MTSYRAAAKAFWHVPEDETDRLNAKIRDLETLLKNENENYRRVNYELDKFKNAPVPIEICDECGGTGKTSRGQCYQCSGKGWVQLC